MNLNQLNSVNSAVEKWKDAKNKLREIRSGACHLIVGGRYQEHVDPALEAVAVASARNFQTERVADLRRELQALGVQLPDDDPAVALP